MFLHEKMCISSYKSVSCRVFAELMIIRCVLRSFGIKLSLKLYTSLILDKSCNKYKSSFFLAKML